MSYTARYGNPGGQGNLLGVRFQANTLIRLADRTGASFGKGFQGAIAGVHERVAITIQQAMVEELHTKMAQGGKYGPRPQDENRPQGHQALEMSILSEDNREVTASGYWVLRESYMDDRSPAKLYWRQIEEGNPKVYRWAGLFTSDFSTFHGPWQTTGGGRKMPEGWPHSRMPQNMPKAVTMEVGPWKPYNFTAGGKRAQLKAGSYIAKEYATALKAIGISMSDVLR